MASKPNKMALLAGCNYEGKGDDIVLEGSINDVTTFKPFLTSRFGFQESDITVLVDSIGVAAELQPTGANIKAMLKKMVASADKGDLVLFYYSGHGTQYTADGEVREAIYPTDGNLITDVDFGDILSGLRGGATFFFISDSCHSGGLLNKGEKTLELSKAFPNPLSRRKNKLIPYPTLKRMLNARAGGGPDATIPDQMKKLFQDNASLKFTSSKEELSSMKEFFSYSGILLAACGPNEECDQDTINNISCGVFSSALQNVLRSKVSPLTNAEVEAKVQAEIQAGDSKDSQHPKLYCDEKDREKIFLFQVGDAPESKDVGLPPLSDRDDFSGGGGKDLDNTNKTYALEQIKDVVEAYYRVSSKTFKDNFEELYEKVATTKGTEGTVTAKDWAELVSSAKNTDKEVVNDFSLELVGTGDDLLDRTDAMMIYYASRTKLQFRCQSESCGNRVLNHLYFTCLSCFKMHEETYNVCSTCLTEKTRCPNGHQNFIDTHSLLQDYHMKELNMPSSSGGEKGARDAELQNALDQAERTFADGPIFNDPKSKALGVNFGLQTDEGCTIM